MFAIEKNPSAVKILQIRNEDEWNGQVTVIHTDMRDWKPEEKLDIIIAELLGKNKNMEFVCSGAQESVEQNRSEQQVSNLGPNRTRAKNQNV